LFFVLFKKKNYKKIKRITTKRIRNNNYKIFIKIRIKLNRMGCGATWVSLLGWGAGQPGFPC
jgi:hypothetical protein